MLGIAATSVGAGLIVFVDALVEELGAGSSGAAVPVVLVAESGTESELAQLRRWLPHAAELPAGQVPPVEILERAVGVSGPGRVAAVAVGNLVLFAARPRVAVLLGAGRARTRWLPSAAAVVERCDLRLPLGDPAVARALVRALSARRGDVAHA